VAGDPGLAHGVAGVFALVFLGQAVVGVVLLGAVMLAGAARLPEAAPEPTARSGAEPDRGLSAAGESRLPPRAAFVVCGIEQPSGHERMGHQPSRAPACAGGNSLGPYTVTAWTGDTPMTESLAPDRDHAPPSALPAPPDPLGALSSRERDVFALLAQGWTDRQISDALYISRRTASKHVSAILAKLGVANRAGAIAVGHSGELGRQEQTHG
jgi:DNA-binding CsgD family transcriptional regulator